VRAQRYTVYWLSTILCSPMLFLWINVVHLGISLLPLQLPIILIFVPLLLSYRFYKLSSFFTCFSCEYLEISYFQVH
jgi:hypothetical protein